MFLSSGIGTQAWPASYRLGPIRLVIGYVRSRNVWRCLGWCEALWCVWGAWVCKCAVGSGEEAGEVLTSAFGVPSISVLHLSKISVLSIIHRLAFQGLSHSRNFRESSTLTPCQLKILSWTYLLPPDRRIPCLFQLWKLGSLFNSHTTVLQEESCHGGSKSEACW